MSEINDAAVEAAAVKPDREVVARALYDASGGQAMSHLDRGRMAKAQADAVLNLWPGRSEAEVKAEALREVRTKIEGAMTALDAYTDEHAETARTALRGCLRAVERIAAEGGAS